MNFTASLEYLNSRTMFGVKLGLENIRKILTKLDSPEQALKFIHIAGTNGKGSTSCLLNAALINSNQKVGMFTSPHLVSVRERIRINGEPISEDIFCRAVELIKQSVNSLENIEPTYFECTTLIAIIAFSEAKCDWVIWETGMGGRLDATNVVSPKVSVITNCALDHTEYLGSTIEEIAAEKGGIIKPSTPIFYGGENPNVRNILAFMAKSMGASFCFRGNDFYLQNYKFSSEGMITTVGFQHGQPIS
ncbi:MAG: bifunctional folylpolyglutamate synthase/dihydrofolate synthase, partial [Lentisphaeria bacterium]